MGQDSRGGAGCDGHMDMLEDWWQLEVPIDEYLLSWGSGSSERAEPWNYSI
jgi:hypothetical protein